MTVDTKGDRTRRRPRQRRKSHIDEMYYDVEFVFNELKTGGGSVRSQMRSKTQLFIQYLTNLGWESDFLNREFKNLNDKLLNTWHFKEFTKQYFEHLIKQKGYNNTMFESLLNIGIRNDVAIILDSIFQPLINSSYSNYQILHSAVEYLQGKYAPITNQSTTHLLNTKKVNKWFEYKNETMTDSLLVLNLPHVCSVQSQLHAEHVLRTLPQIQTSSLFFHATSWKFALSIFEYLNRYAGRPCLDFGVWPGFYMSETITECIDWGIKNTKRWSNEIAILVFAIPSQLSNDIKYKELIDNTWIQVTKDSRECKDKINELVTIRDIDLLYGNMVSNAIQVSDGLELPKTHNPPKKQLVSKTDRGDKFIRNCLIGCVFFQKYVEQKQK